MFIQTTPDGLQLKVRAHAGARRSRVVGEHGDALKIETTAAPEHGKANSALRKIIAEKCELPLNAVQLRTGETSRDKIFLLTEIDAPTAQSKLLAP
jgi:uncharacterized protein (TIGR00251 family)